MCTRAHRRPEPVLAILGTIDRGPAFPHLQPMTPPEPANDERPPLWPGMSNRPEERLQWAFVIVGLAAGIAFMLAVSTPSTG